MRALPEEIRVLIVELLLCGWTPKDIAECGEVQASPATINRIARATGLSSPRGGPRPFSGGAREGAGRPTGSLTSKHRDEVIQLRQSGLSWRQIAARLGLRSYQHAQQLAKQVPDEKRA